MDELIDIPKQDNSGSELAPGIMLDFSVFTMGGTMFANAMGFLITRSDSYCHCVQSHALCRQVIVVVSICVAGTIMAGTKFAMIVRYFAGGCFTRCAVACGHPPAIVMAGIVAELSHPLHEGGGTSWL